MRWIKDEEFIRDRIPLTKFEARVMTMAMLEIEADDKLIDIGAGTGGITIEASLQGAHVIAVEKEPKGVELILKNAEKFGVSPKVIQGTAPECLSECIEFNKCFIGGSKGRMKEIILWVHKHLPEEGMIVGNFVTLNNLMIFKNTVEDFGYKEVDVRLIQASRMEQKTQIIKGQNPIFIIKAVKQRTQER